MATKITIASLRRMKRDGVKIVGVVAWDFQMARIADLAGVDLVSVGDSVGVNLWGRAADAEVTVEEMLVCCKAVRSGATRALVSCDIPTGADARRAAGRLAHEGGAEMVKVLGEPELVREIVKAGVPVFAEFHGENAAVAKLVERAKRLEEAGASLLDFRHSGPAAGAAVAAAVSIPVIGGLGGGPWLDGRVRLAHTAIGYAAKWIDAGPDPYGNAAKLSLDALRALAEDVRAGRQIKGG
jgi:3-methyl-2-oxobutanoate hydroxymethyltransferase